MTEEEIVQHTNTMFPLITYNGKLYKLEGLSKIKVNGAWKSCMLYKDPLEETMYSRLLDDFEKFSIV